MMMMMLSPIPTHHYLGRKIQEYFDSPLLFPLCHPNTTTQVDPGKYKGLFASIKLIMAEEGAVGIWKGWLPTAIGYSMQGCFKFGLYEFFKDFYSNVAGEEASYTYRGMIYLAGSASAEVFADAALCPMEMVKVSPIHIVGSI